MWPTASDKPENVPAIKNIHHLHAQLKIALEIWEEIQNDPYPADRWLGNFFHRYRKKFGARERRFFSETIYAAFRHKTFLESWSEALEDEKNPACVVLMAAASEGLVSIEEFESVYPHIFSSRFRAGKLYQNLQSRELPEIKQNISEEEKLSIRFSFPLWLVKRWTERYGIAECGKMLATFQERPRLTIRVNPLKISRDLLIKRFQKRGLAVSPTPRSDFGIIFKERANLFDSEEFREGLFEVQDEGSQRVCQHIDPKPNETVWDVCAGGGGKSLMLAGLMHNKGRIIATDIRPQKLLALRKRANRAGVTNIFPADLSRMGEIRQAKNGIDKILVDAPCSGTGTLRRNPDAKWKLSENVFEKFHKDQLAIIERSLPYLKKGGQLYYVTCSMEPAENEEVMREIFALHPELEQVRLADSPDGYLRMLPHRDQTDGFFLGIAENKK